VSPQDITEILQDVRHGEKGAPARSLPLVNDELRRLASLDLRPKRPDLTRQPTALVHEAYLKLVDQTWVDWQNRAHFFGAES
jgi:hypothetical protein